jgi:2-oxoglutarate dehydrogenase E1 component
MESFNLLANSEYIEELYAKYQQDPQSVDETWRLFFSGFELGLGRPVLGGSGGGSGEFATLSQRRQDGTGDLVHSYRELGHTQADLDPLKVPRASHPLLNLNEFGFSETERDRNVGSGGFLGATDGTLGDLIDKLRLTYCGSIGVEYMDIRDKAQRDWLQEHIEPNYNQPQLTNDDRKRVLDLLIQAEEFENFLQTKFVGQKRFSIEGGEALIPLLDTIVEAGAENGAQAMVFGMAHRGRLNVLAHLMKKPYEFTLSEFEGAISDEASNDGDGDVKYHKGYSNDRETKSGRVVHLSLSSNPSHLEIVDPVVEGVVRAKQDRLGEGGHEKVVPLLIHGEAAFAGQGIVTETLNLSELSYYRTGGTIHVIINNQLGFTATATQTRFTPYPTDVAKAIQAPIFHVNADDPEAVAHVGNVAAAFRQRFKVDVMVDLWCYRRYGHNETDDPTFTQPVMYERIRKQTPVGQAYAARLVTEGVVTEGEVEAMRAEVRGRLENALTVARKDHPREKTYTFLGLWKGLTRASTDWSAKTTISDETIKRITSSVMQLPESFTIHKKLQKLYELRQEMSEGKKPADWGCAEMWALGSLLLDGTPVRLTGQDAERGTFSHRHAVLHDFNTGEEYAPLAHMEQGQARLTIVNTMLSELAVLGFEYGYSSADPRSLVMWEAQFGDFVNMAQPIIDQFISSSESKWQRMSGLVLLLPHGYEGQGPEHSSARLERFLQMCADNNMQVGYPTTPAQYFHLLRRQVLRPFRKPLVLMMPKSLLRDPRSVSTLDAFTAHGFETVIDDPAPLSPQVVERVVFCTGKVFYAAQAKRDEQDQKHIALIRVEQLYPFPEAEIARILARYSQARDIVWVQEEPKNMGAWFFMEPRLRKLLPAGATLTYRGRKEASSPATGVYKWHLKEEEEFIRQTLSVNGDVTDVKKVGAEASALS